MVLTNEQVAALPPLSPNVACSLANIRDNIRFGRTSATLDLLRVVDELDSQRAQVAVLLAERDALKTTIAKAYPYTEDPLYGQKRVAQLIAHYMGQADELAALLVERDALKAEREGFFNQIIRVGRLSERESNHVRAALNEASDLWVAAETREMAWKKRADQAEAALSALRARETGLREWVKRMQEPGASTYRVTPPEGFLDGYREAMSDVQDAMQEAAAPGPAAERETEER